MNGKSIRTFLGANTPNGFFSYYEPFTDGKKAYIIKGGPGTGKSGLMKKIANEAINQGHFTEYVYCSSDPHSLDAIYVPDLNLVVADGTSPHTLDPKVPGALGGIINMSDFWDEGKLQKSLCDIQELQGKIAECFAKAYHYLNAAGSIRSDIKNTVLNCLLAEKAEKYIRNFCNKNMPNKKQKQKGTVKKRFLSGITPAGFVYFNDTIYTLCDKVYVLRDDNYISSYFIQKFLDAAVIRGYDAYAFYSPLSPEEAIHIAIPELDLAIVTTSPRHNFEPNQTKRINLKRFLSEEIYYSAKRLSFAKRVLGLCLDEANLSLKNEKALHDDLEEYYISAMDFNKVDKAVKKFSDSILKQR